MHIMDTFRDNIVNNYLYLSLWGIISCILLNGKFTENVIGRLVKYKQRECPVKTDEHADEAKKLQEEKIKRFDEIQSKLNRHNKWVRIALITSILITLINILYNAFINRRFYFIDAFPVLFGLASIFALMDSTLKKQIKALLIFCDIVFALAIYTKYSWGENYFFDGIFVALTLTTFLTAKKFHYAERVTVFLLGFNMIIVNEKYLYADSFNLLRNIIFAMATSILASAVILIFTDYEDRKKRLKLRQFMIDELKDGLESLVECLYDDFYYGKECLPFSCMNYDKFVEEFTQNCLDENFDILSLMESSVNCELEFCIKRINTISKRSDEFRLNKVFNWNEIIEIEELGFYFKKILSFYRKKDNRRVEECFSHFFKKLDFIAYQLDEIDNMIQSFGKEKIIVHYEIGTMRPVWSDGTKITANDYVKYKERQKDRNSRR